MRHVKEGDYVSAESHVTCGACYHCRTGRAHMCEQTQILGVDRNGAFAQYVAVPESVIWQNDRSKLPPEIATLQEPFGNAVFALSHEDVAGKSVAILGCGPVGLFSIGIARASGAGRVLASDRRPFRLGLAERMGAHEVLDLREVADAPAWFVEHNEGEHPDVVFEMSGAREAIVDAFRIARNGGRVILFGIPAQPVELDVAEELIFKNLNVSAVSGREVFATWYKTRWLLEHGVVDLRPLITSRADAQRVRASIRVARVGRCVQDRPAPERRTARGARRNARRCRRGRRLAVQAGKVGPSMSTLDEQIAAELDALRAAGTYKRFNTLESPQGPVVTMAGRGEVIVLSSNNYLGLADHPDVVRAGIDGPRALRRRHRVRPLHLRHLRPASRAGARPRRALGDGSGTDVRLLLERERGRDPDARGREHRHPVRRAEPRVDHRRGAPREA